MTPATAEAPRTSVSQSLDSAALEKVKQMLKLAQEQDYDSIVARFDNDVDYTVRSSANGFDREFLRIEDIRVKGTLLNVGWTLPERSESIARPLYIHECKPAALKAGLLSTVNDDPFVVMWSGVAYSVADFVEVFIQHKILTFTETLFVDPNLGYNAAVWAD